VPSGQAGTVMLLLPQPGRPTDGTADQAKGAGSGASSLRLRAAARSAPSGRLEDKYQAGVSALPRGRPEFAVENEAKEGQRAAR